MILFFGHLHIFGSVWSRTRWAGKYVSTRLSSSSSSSHCFRSPPAQTTTCLLFLRWGKLFGQANPRLISFVTVMRQVLRSMGLLPLFDVAFNLMCELCPNQSRCKNISGCLLIPPFREFIIGIASLGYSVGEMVMPLLGEEDLSNSLFPPKSQGGTLLPGLRSRLRPWLLFSSSSSLGSWFLSLQDGLSASQEQRKLLQFWPKLPPQTVLMRPMISNRGWRY